MTYQLDSAKGTITIRPASVDDGAALRELRLEALSNQPEAFAADIAASQADPAEVWVERVRSYLTEKSGVICVACADARLAGMAGLARGIRPKTRHSANIWGVYTTPEWRGMHVAEALVKECLAWAMAQGIRVVKLAVITTNTPAIRCYTRLGFSVFGVEPQVIFYDGVYYDELLMVKAI